MKSLSPGRAVLMKAIGARRDAQADVDTAQGAYALARSAVEAAERKLQGVKGAERSSGADLAERFRTAARHGGTPPSGPAIGDGAVRRAEAESELSAAQAALALLGADLERERARAADAEAAVQTATRDILGEELERLADEAGAALETLKRIRRDMIAIEAASYTMSEGALRKLTISPAARLIMRWELANGDTSVTQQAKQRHTQVWREFRDRLVSDPVADPPAETTLAADAAA